MSSVNRHKVDLDLGQEQEYTGGYSRALLQTVPGPVNELSIILKNNSAKTVTAFSISPSNGFTIIEEFVLAEISDIGIAPNALFAKSYPTLTSIQPQSIEIKALLFDDGRGIHLQSGK